MSTLREIKGHISSVGSIAQVTRAMELVSAAKGHRISDRVESTRPFATKSWEVLNHLAAAAQQQVREDPLFCGYAQITTIGTILITSNRGMAGAYNQNVIELALQAASSAATPMEFVTIGRVGREAVLRTGHRIHADFSDLTDTAEIAAITPVARVVMDGFRDKGYGQVSIAYTPFERGKPSQPVIRQILPVCPEVPGQIRQYIYEPAPEELLLTLVPRLVRFQIYQAFLESLAAENMARRLAMHAATRNAQDIMEHLKISHNKVRQQTITREIADILGAQTALDEG
jgi:F-type H+-transporting ATPase subunit gamma